MLRVEFTTALGKLLRWAWAHGINVALDWGKRDSETQARMVNAGLSKTMKSKHLIGLAADLLVFDDDGNYITDGEHPHYTMLGEQWERLGGIWGGRWTSLFDPGHFEWSKKT